MDNRQADAPRRMEALLAPDHVWLAAAGMSVLAVGQAGRSVLDQARRGSREARDETVWTEVSTAARRLGTAGPPATATMPDHDADRVVIKALSRRRTRALALEALTSAARVDRRIPRSLRGRTELVAVLRTTVTAQLREKDAGRRAAAAELVATLRLRSCRGAIAAATSDLDAGVRIAACRCLARIDPAQAFGVLLRLVETDGAWAADLLADVARRLEQRGARDVVAARATDWALTPAVVRLLAEQRPSKRSGAILRGAAQAGDGDVRAGAAEALGRNPHPEAVGALIDLLGDDEERVRLNAVRALGGLAALGSRVALIDLSAMLADPSRRVRFAAGAALATLPGGRSMLAQSEVTADPLVREAVAMALWDDDPATATATGTATATAAAAAPALREAVPREGLVARARPCARRSA